MLDRDHLPRNREQVVHILGVRLSRWLFDVMVGSRNLRRYDLDADLVALLCIRWKTRIVLYKDCGEPKTRCFVKLERSRSADSLTIIKRKGRALGTFHQ